MESPASPDDERGPDEDAEGLLPDETSLTGPNLALRASRLRALERWNLSFNRKSITSRWANACLAACQRTLGASWVEYCTRNLRVVIGRDRLPDLRTTDRFILASNHRSYFDLYAISMLLFKEGGLRSRMIFPVRSSFFYDHPLGFFVNGVMSFWSMYPPIFRDRKRSFLNHTSFEELASFLQNGRLAVGIHPEGTRNKGDDPYSFLPPQSGVGRLIQKSRVPVIPVFINGLQNNLIGQVRSNFDRSGTKIIVAFGAPIDFGDLLSAEENTKTYREITSVVMRAITALSEEEKAARATLSRE